MIKLIPSNKNLLFTNQLITMMQREEYILEWLDTTVNFSLNPYKKQMKEVNESQIQSIRQRAMHETDQQKIFLERGALALYSQKKIHVFITQYHHALLSLLNQSHANLSAIDEKTEPVFETCQAVTNCIEQILDYIESRFREFFTTNRPIPLKYSSELKTEIKSRADIIKTQFQRSESANSLADIVLKILYDFCLDSPEYVNHQQAVYFKKLVSEMEDMLATSDQNHLADQFEKILIRLNFNHSSFINHFTRSIANNVNSFLTPEERMSSLLAHRKEFSQLSINQKGGLIPEMPSIKKSINSWFKKEADYLKSIDANQIHPTASSSIAVKQPVKVMCLLSVDQMAIILRAMDALRIIQAKSMSVIFETIVPFLSTTQRADLSWQSMRNKSYAFEEHDRKAAIDTLESMIKFIREV